MRGTLVGHDDPWPLRHLVLRTPRLELRPDDDAGLLELAEEARLGVHPPELMPFVAAVDRRPRRRSARSATSCSGTGEACRS